MKGEPSRETTSWVGQVCCALAFTLALAACAAPAATATSSPPTSPPVPSATTSPVPPTQTPEATATPTEPPTPTPIPVDRTISPATLAQLRPLWTLEAPGNANAQGGCEDVACWMPTRIGSYAFSSDGETLAVGICTVDPTENTTNPRKYRYNCPGPSEVRLYDSATGELRQTLAVGDFPISLAFHPNGRILAAGMAQRSVEVWDLDAAKKIQTLLHSTTHDGVSGVGFSPDGSMLVTSGDHRLQLWHWETGVPAGTIDSASRFSVNPAGGTVATVFISASGQYSGGYTEARLYSLDDPSKFKAVPIGEFTNYVVYSADGSRLVDNSLDFYDSASGKLLGQADLDRLLKPSGLDGYIGTYIGLTPDGLLLFTVSVKGSDGDWIEGLGLWDPLTDGARVWMLSIDEMIQLGIDFNSFEAAPLTLPLTDRNFAILDANPYYGSGTLSVWGVDPTTSPDGVTCLGTCSS